MFYLFYLYKKNNFVYLKLTKNAYKKKNLTFYIIFTLNPSLFLKKSLKKTKKEVSKMREKKAKKDFNFIIWWKLMLLILIKITKKTKPAIISIKKTFYKKLFQN